MNKTLLVLTGLLLIMVGISSGCIGGKGDGGDQPVEVKQGEINPEIAGKETQTAPETQTQPETKIIPKTENQIDKPLLSGVFGASTPEETVQEYIKAGQEERYEDAGKYWARPMTAKNEYRFFTIWPENGAKIEKIEMSVFGKGSKERWSEKYQKPIKYEVAGVYVKVYYTKKDREKTKEASFHLIKIDGVWKLNNLN